MGVLGLWDILESVGHPVKVEGLEGKVLGVDANIWLYKFIRGFREKDGASNIESHKLGLFNRISKLLFYRIKPVFVFDGPAPILKRRTLERRQNTRNKTLFKVQDAAVRALANQLKSQYPGQDIDQLRIKLPELRSNNLVAAEKLGEEDFNLFYLPPETANTKKDEESDEYDSYSEDELEQAIRDSSKVDVDSKDFKSLPAELRYEILQDIKAKRRRIRNVTLPDDAGSFSNLQLQRLKARRGIQEKIEQCEQEICRNYTGELADGRSVQAFRVQSNKDLRILYCNNTYDPKALDKLKEEPNEDEIEETPIETKDTKQPTCSKSEVSCIDLSDDSEVETSKLESRRLTTGTITIDSSIEESKVDSDYDAESDLEENDIVETKRVKLTPEPVEEDSDQSESPSPDTSCVIVADISSDSESSSRSSSQIDSKNNDEESAPEKQSQAPESSPRVREAQTIVESDEETCLSPVMQQTEPKSAPKSHSNYTPSMPNIDAMDPQPPTKSKEKIRETSQMDEMSHERPISPPKPIPERQTQAVPVMTQAAPQTTQVGSQGSSQITQSSSQTTSSQMISQSEHVANAQRATNKVTSKIIEDAKELLRLFGIPYIDAAGEAEAQCAKLEELNLTMGTITDDSDIWLFGAQNVYRYFFSDDKYVMQYKMPDIEYHIRMTRENLVCFAMLVGSDYTDGIMNVGPVTALEILSEFPAEGLECLCEFTQWQRAAIQDKKLIGDKKRKKLLKYQIPGEFPSRAVYDGYMNPVADTTGEKFTWGTPELDELREYARRNFGWDQKRTDEKLLPVMKRLNEKIQKTIDTFFFKTQANRNPEMFRSKRVNQALNKIAKRAALDTEVVNLSEDEES